MGRRPRRRAPQIAHECLRIRSVGRPSARSRVSDRTRVCRSERDILIGYKTPELLTLRHRLRMFEVPSQIRRKLRTLGPKFVESYRGQIVKRLVKFLELLFFHSNLSLHEDQGNWIPNLPAVLERAHVKVDEVFKSEESSRAIRHFPAPFRRRFLVGPGGVCRARA